MDAMVVTMLATIGLLVTFVIGLLVYAYSQFIMKGYKEAKVFGMFVYIVGSFGTTVWMLGGLFAVFGATGSVLWSMLVYILVSFAFGFVSVNAEEIVNKWKKQWPEVYGRK